MVDVEIRSEGKGKIITCGKCFVALLVFLATIVLGAIIVLAILVADHRPDISDNRGDIVELQKLKTDLAALKTLLDDTKVEVITIITTTKTQIDSTISTTKSGLEGQINTAKSGLEGQINTAETNLKAEITSKVSTAKSGLEGQINTAKSGLEGQINTAKTDLKAEITSKVSTAKSGLEGQINTAKSGLEGQINTAKSGLEGQINTAKTNLKVIISSNVSAAKSDLQGQINTAKSGLEEQINTAKSGLEGQINITTSGLEGQINTAKADLQGKIDVLNTWNVDYKAGQQFGAIYMGQMELDDKSGELGTAVVDDTITVQSDCIKKCAQDNTTSFAMFDEEAPKCVCYTTIPGKQMEVKPSSTGLDFLYLLAMNIAQSGSGSGSGSGSNSSSGDAEKSLTEGIDYEIKTSDTCTTVLGLEECKLLAEWGDYDDSSTLVPYGCYKDSTADDAVYNNLITSTKPCTQNNPCYCKKANPRQALDFNGEPVKCNSEAEKYACEKSNFGDGHASCNVGEMCLCVEGRYYDEGSFVCEETS